MSELVAGVVIRADGDIDARDFAGSFWTERFFKDLGLSSVIIETGKNKVLMDNEYPFARYGDKEARARQEEFIRTREKQGWRFSASWGYAVFVWEPK